MSCTHNVVTDAYFVCGPHESLSYPHHFLHPRLFLPSPLRRWRGGGPKLPGSSPRTGRSPARRQDEAPRRRCRRLPTRSPAWRPAGGRASIRLPPARCSSPAPSIPVRPPPPVLHLPSNGRGRGRGRGRPPLLAALVSAAVTAPTPPSGEAATPRPRWRRRTVDLAGSDDPLTSLCLLAYGSQPACSHGADSGAAMGGGAPSPPSVDEELHLARRSAAVQPRPRRRRPGK